MKAYTDIEQSKKLAEILPLESADMCYRMVAYNPDDTHVYQPYCFVGTLESDVPCWSLATLIEHLPRCIETEECLVFLDIYKSETYGWIIEYSNNQEDVFWIYSDNHNLIDACVEMILRLHEQKVL